MQNQHAEEVAFGNFCDSKWCQFLAALEFEPGTDASDTLDQAMPNEEQPVEFQIGNVKTISARRNCVSCQFAHVMIERRSHPGLTSDTVCYAHVFSTYLSWTIIYYNVDGKLCSLHSTWEQISFLENSRLTDFRAARLVEPPELNYKRIRYWLRLCDKLHTACPLPTMAQTSNPQDTPPHLRVVDVQEMCITDISWGERYVALSYVWGDATPLLLLKSSVAFWETKNSLRARESSFPQTIRDAIEVTRHMAMRYLWFDSLCLLQDDPEDLRRSINNMDLIYERAYLTIVAANSPSANNGLPGVRKPRLREQKIYQIKPNVSFVLLSPLGVHLRNSAWGSRGWTLQEQQLSRRILAFVNNQVFFQCRESIWSEDRMTDQDPEKMKWMHSFDQLINTMREEMDNMEESDLTTPYHYLQTVLETFQRRNLTLESDAYNAVAGFLRRISEAANTEMIEGLPTKTFPGHLLFYNREVHFDRPVFGNTSMSSDEVRRRTGFPSWSWAGWRARSDWRIHEQIGIIQDKDGQETVQWLADANWITWWALEAGSDPKLIHRPANIMHEFALDTPVVSTGDAVLASTTTPSARVEGLMQEAEKGNTIAETSIPTNLPYNLLIFSTFSVHMRFGSLIANSNFCFQLVDNSGSTCGEIIPDYVPDFHMLASDIGDVNSQADATTAVSAVYEFALISERRTGMPEECDKDPEKKSTYWILMIEWLQDKGVYERRGLGHLQKTSIYKSFAPGMQWKTIVLG